MAAITAFRTVRARMLFWILVVVVPIHMLSTWLSYRATAGQLEASAIRGADQMAMQLASDLDAEIRPIQAAIHTLAAQLGQTDAPRARYVNHIRGLLDAWQDIYGSTIAAEVDGDGTPFAPYLYRRDGRIEHADLARDSYGYRALPWYRLAADSGKPAWSPPYFDRGGGDIWMVTYSVPFFREGDHALAGVVTADLDLQWMRRAALRVSPGPAGMGWISSGTGTEEIVLPVGDTARRLEGNAATANAAAARAAAHAMLARDSAFGLARGIDGRPAYLAAHRVGTLGWTLTVLTPRDALLGEARAQLRQQIVLGGIGLALLLGAIMLVAAGIARPIHALAEAVEQVGQPGTADLHFNLPEKPRRDEVGVLTRALAQLRDTVQQHVQLRAASLAAQARLEHELEVAAQIQQSMLPQGDTLRAVPPGIEIAATLIPARQVGGDLYDYFHVPGGELLFAVADVSDKGIPAALLMARLSGLMRVLGATGSGPERVLGEINGRLAEGNEACMFVTVGCGLLDPDSGAFRYASAGHDAPLLRRVEGEVRVFDGENGTAIGIDADSTYPLWQGQLAPGDALLLYTDGLSEAEGEGGAQLGIERIAALLREARDARPAVLVAHIVDTVASDAAGFRATDDLTVMALRFVPADVATRVEPDGTSWLITVEPSSSGLLRAQQRLRGILLAREVGADLVHDLELVTEEWLTNVLKAAGAAPLRRFELDLLLSPAAIRLVFRDDGVPFDPLQAEGPDLELAVTDRPIGGLGLHLVRQVAQSCDYTRAGGCNVLTVRFVRN